MISFQNFIDRGLIKNDRGRAITRSALLDDVARAFEDPSVQRAIWICPRRSGKSQAGLLAILWILLTRPQAHSILVASTGSSAEAVAQQKLIVPARTSGFSEVLNLTRDRVTNTEIWSEVEIVTPTERGSVGRTCDLIVVDEARFIPQDIVETLAPSAMGGKLFIFSSASAPSGWLFEEINDPGDTRIKILTSLEQSGNPEASPAFVERERKRLSKKGDYGVRLFEREYRSAFVDVGGDSFLSVGDIQKARVKEVEAYRPESDRCVIGADLALTRDTASAVCCAARKDGSIRIVDGFEFRPEMFKDRTIKLELIESALLALSRKYKAPVVVDQWQAALLVDRLREQRVDARGVHLTSSFLWSCWEKLSENLRNQTLTWPKSLPRLDVDAMMRELVGLRLEESPRSGSLRVTDSDRKSAHRDRSVSLILSLSKIHSDWGSIWFDHEPNYEPAGASMKYTDVAWYDWTPKPTVEEEQRQKLREAEERYAEACRGLLTVGR